MVWAGADGIEKNKQGRIVPVHIPVDKINDIADLLTTKAPTTDLNFPNDIVPGLYSKLILLLIIFLCLGSLVRIFQALP